MGYLASFGDRLIRSPRDAESKITEDDPEREQKQKGVCDLTTVTTNRVRVIHLSIQALIPAPYDHPLLSFPPHRTALYRCSQSRVSVLDSAALAKAGPPQRSRI